MVSGENRKMAGGFPYRKEKVSFVRKKQEKLNVVEGKQPLKDFKGR